MLELWEIKAYRDRIERDRDRLTTRRQAGIVTKPPDRLDPSQIAEERRSRIFNQNLQEIKQRTEENLRQQREAFRAAGNRVVTTNNSPMGGIIR